MNRPSQQARADYVTAAAFNYWRVRRNHWLCGTEFEPLQQGWRADILSSDGNLWIETEVKVCKSDFLNDFDKDKHHRFKTGSRSFIPDYFYYAIPPHMEYVVRKEIDARKLPYGILVVPDWEEDRHHSWLPTWPKIAFRAKKIKHVHYDRDRARSAIQEEMTKRVSTMCARLMRAQALEGLKEAE